MIFENALFMRFRQAAVAARFGVAVSHNAIWQFLCREVIRAAGARLWFLPPYSPDLNPIEQTFAKIKHWMRTAQKRTVEDTWRHAASLVSTVKQDECANYFENAGYPSVK